MKVIPRQRIEAKKGERTSAFKEVKRMRKEFGVAAGMLKSALEEWCCGK
ncbi:hypothetical protein [Rhodobacter viridis]|nr:hypothetical protein [Rhodobacter viridis]